MDERTWMGSVDFCRSAADKMADCLYKAAEETDFKIRKDTTDGDPDKEGYLYILKHTKCPAVLTENLFQDNKEDVAFLLSEAGKETIVCLHVKGIINYLKTI
jgi:N-acetylmuramoyl-L-alanine amidase